MITEEIRSRFDPEILQIIEGFRLIDDTFMVKVLEDPACTQLVLRIILDIDDLIVTKVQTQDELKNLQGRSVKLDVHAVDSKGKHYNIEVQRSDKGAVAKRARYNSSLLDANITEPGEEYELLPESYVIFITENDVLKEGLPIYHIDRIVRETGKPFDDKSNIVYVNSQIKDDSSLGKLMQDFYCRSAGEMHYPTLAERVHYFKEEEGVMTMCRAVEQYGDKKMQAGRKAGKKAMVINLLKMGLSYEQIAMASELTVDEIKKIENEQS